MTHKPHYSVQTMAEVIRLNRIFKCGFSFLVCISLLLSLTGCMQENQKETGKTIPEIPAQLSYTNDGTPLLKVYNTSTESTEEMDVETYLMGVVAGEMKNTWPMEALKAQAVLARTFTMKFLSDKVSSYGDADISTDVKEAQAYNADAVNDRIREAVNETRGVVMNADGEFPYAWFHAHSGGKTELPMQALEYNENPPYLSVVSSDEPNDAPEDVKNWTAEFTLKQAEQACKNVGVETGPIKTFEIGDRGESGRAINFLVNGKKISAPAFRIQINASKLKSTLLDSIRIYRDKIIFSGKGFGHGVGMSQWGARNMAEKGKSAEEIIKHYFTGIELVELW